MINEDIKVIISVLGLGISAIGLVVSILANLKSHNANKISQAGVEKAEEANRISKEANNTAARSLEVSKRENISRFAIEITDIEWDNDGFLSDTIDEALRCGTFRCRFKVENLSINKALFMGFEKEPSQLRSKGVHVSVENYVQIENNFSLDCLLEKEPIYDVKIINCLEKLSGDTKLSYIGIMVYTAVLVNWLLNLGLKNMIMMRDKNANYI